MVEVDEKDDQKKEQMPWTFSIGEHFLEDLHVSPTQGRVMETITRCV